MRADRSRVLELLLVEDDVDDQVLLVDALQECGVPHRLRIVQNGEELMDYLAREGAYSDPRSSPRPSLVILDLNMPRMSGLEVLERRKLDPLFSMIPVVVFTASWSEDDIRASYALGVNSFITKPVQFERLVRTIGALAEYWLELCETPTLHL